MKTNVYAVNENGLKQIHRFLTDHHKKGGFWFTRQKGKCPSCNKSFAIDGMEADHVTPWSKGGKTIAANCQMLCKMDNRTKSGK